ncbi:DUF721 domain-containing protein [Limoniibacter endophyticus]|uniref:DUF721 domain-containing protein n=1 Tax=Limoniibacter endophyticus TaxID=1565040 RepID=A0A8J3DHB8_9HYPH|nr:DciA family protein [Limoniibacter endophyticus]GHC71614.1 hypothetical protein GCM10010136_18980 [Limoniibacter endophyticus]
MAANERRSNPVAVADLATSILDPLLRKRAGMSVALVQSWEEIVGPRLSKSSRPEKIVWARRRHPDDPFEPSLLVIACEGIAALHIQHETREVISRVNAFMGFNAIGRIRIVQKPLIHYTQKKKPEMRPLQRDEKQKVEALCAGIENDDLRASLERLGQTIKAAKTVR